LKNKFGDMASLREFEATMELLQEAVKPYLAEGGKVYARLAGVRATAKERGYTLQYLQHVDALVEVVTTLHAAPAVVAANSENPQLDIAALLANGQDVFDSVEAFAAYMEAAAEG